MQPSLMLLPFVALVSGCIDQSSQKSSDNGSKQQAAATPSAAMAATPAAQPQPGASSSPGPETAMLARINGAAPGTAPLAQPSPVPASPVPTTAAGAPPQTPPDPFAIRAEVLLARARFSPGVADGEIGSNIKHAIAAYQAAHDLPVSNTIDSATWQALSSEPGANQPAVHDYVIAPADVGGPFAADVGEDFVKLAALPNGPQFTTPVEALAERFHMSQDLLKSLNPGIDFTKPGGHIIVVDDAPPAFSKGDVARIDVSKSGASAKAYDHDGKLVAFYPATVGSTERPSPSGTHKVVGVAWNPDYTYDPKKLHWGPRAAGKLLIKPGPNNPVGMVWIDLNAPGYGIHGTPEPDKIGKTASHGCVRLTNWDALDLAHGVKPGVVVHFLGERGGAKS